MIHSDIDMMLVVPGTLDSATKKWLAVEIIERAINKYGLPRDAPIEVRLADAESFRLYQKICRKNNPSERDIGTTRVAVVLR